MENVGVKPARKGMGLSHPIGGVLPDEGGLWPDDQFTKRRLRDGDVKLHDLHAKPDAEKPATEAPEKAAPKAAKPKAAPAAPAPAPVPAVEPALPAASPFSLPALAEPKQD